MAFGFGMSLPVAISTALGNQNRYAAIINDAGELAPYVTFTRSSTATRYNSAGLLETVAIGIPRYDYDPTTVTRANLLRYSQEFDNASWPKTSLSVTANATVAPDDTLSADKLVEAVSAVTAHSVGQLFTSTSGTSYTLSVCVKKAEREWVLLQFNSAIFSDASARNLYVNSADGSLGTIPAGTTASSINLGNGWWRFSFTVTATLSASGAVSIYTANANNGVGYAGDGTSGLFVWGVQLETGSTATDYIPTGIIQIGPELVVNGDFSNGTTGWSFINDNGTVTTQTVTNGVLTYGNLGPSVWPKILNNNVKARPGAQYLVTMTVTAITSADGNPSTTAYVSLGDVAGRASRNITAPGTYQLFVINSSALTSGFEVIFHHGDLTSISISQISVKEINSDYNSPRGNATLRGLLIEEQRTNLFRLSSEFSDTTWSKGSGVTVTANTIVAPDGSISADAVQFTSGGGVEFVRQALTLTVGTVYTVSIYARLVSGTPTFNFDIGNGPTPGSSQFTPTSAWQRFSYTFTFSGTNQWIDLEASSGGTIAFWGAQLEAGTFATSYIPTTTAAVTRAADIATISNLANIGYNEAEGSIFAEAATFSAASDNKTLASINDGTTSERIFCAINVSASRARIRVTDGGVSTADFLGESIIVGSMFKYASVYKINDFALTTNGNTPVTFGAGTIPTVDRMMVGHSGSSVTGVLNGHIRRLRYYPKRLTNAQLQALTA